MSATPTPAACIAAGRSCTVISGYCPPTTSASATPLTPRSAPTTVGSAIAVSASWLIVAEVTVSERIDCSAGSNRVMIGSSISVGRSPRMVLIASRTSWAACATGLLKSKKTVNCARPSTAFERVIPRSRPSIEKIASSIGSTTSRSTTSGDAPG